MEPLPLRWQHTNKHYKHPRPAQRYRSITRELIVANDLDSLCIWRKVLGWLCVFDRSVYSGGGGPEASSAVKSLEARHFPVCSNYTLRVT